MSIMQRAALNYNDMRSVPDRDMTATHYLLRYDPRIDVIFANNRFRN